MWREARFQEKTFLKMGYRSLFVRELESLFVSFGCEIGEYQRISVFVYI